MSNLEKNYLHEEDGVIAYILCSGVKDNCFVYGIKVYAIKEDFVPLNIQIGRFSKNSGKFSGYGVSYYFNIRGEVYRMLEKVFRESDHQI